MFSGGPGVYAPAPLCQLRSPVVAVFGVPRIQFWGAFVLPGLPTGRHALGSLALLWLAQGDPLSGLRQIFSFSGSAQCFRDLLRS